MRVEVNLIDFTPLLSLHLKLYHFPFFISVSSFPCFFCFFFLDSVYNKKAGFFFFFFFVVNTLECFLEGRVLSFFTS
jgi:hypothetical protein